MQLHFWRLLMAYKLGQMLGIAATLLCIAIPFWKKKWQMLVNTIVVNLFVALNFILIGRIGSAFAMCLIAVVQSIVALVHNFRDTPVRRWEQVLFLVLYVGLGLYSIVSAPGFIPEVSFVNLLELLPVAAAAVLVISVFLRDEQQTRKLNLLNALLWFVYDAIVGATAAFSQLISIAANVTAMLKYRKKN